MRRFDADGGHDADGYAGGATSLAADRDSPRLEGRPGRRPPDRLLARHPHLDAATTAGALATSAAREIARLEPAASRPRRTPHQEADKILVEAAAAGADLDDLKLVAQAAYEAWRAQEPDPEDDLAREGVR